MPRVSVHISCYNSEKYISETIKSVLGQRFGDFELIIINDGSRDRTEEIVKSFRDSRIKYLYQDNQGLPRARNRAVALSNSEFIAFLDHDDLWLPDKLEKQISVFDKDADIALVYTNYYKLYPDGKKALGLSRKQPEGRAFGQLLLRYTVSLTTTMVRRKALIELGDLFNERLRIFEDYDVFMRIIFKHKVAYLRQPLTIYRIHDDRATYLFRSSYPDEFDYALKNLGKLDPYFADKYGNTVHYLRAGISHLRAKVAMEKTNDRREARHYLKPYRLVSIKFFMLYILTFLPSFVWNRLHYCRNKGVAF